MAKEEKTMTGGLTPAARGLNAGRFSKEVPILIAEDDGGHYLLALHCLREAGIENKIVRFEDGKSLLDYLTDRGNARTDKKQILLLDIQLPEIDGIELLRKIRGDPNLKSTFVLVLTTSRNPETERQCYELGCDAYLIKPPGKALIRAIARLQRRLR